MKPIIIAHGTVLTCDRSNRCGRYHILVDGGRILDVSERLELLTKDRPDAMIIDAKGKLVVPGFVNAHYHGASFLLREATTGMHYGFWKNDACLNQATTKFVHPSSGDDVFRVYQAAYLAHLKSGTTCVGEFPPSLDENSFIRMVEGIESSGINSVIALQNWEQIRKAQSLGAKHLRTVVNLGKEEDFTVYSFEHLSKAAKELKSPLLAHIAETKEACEVIRQNFQRDPVTVLSAFNVLHANTVIVHANYVTEEEAQTTKGANATIVVCPRSTAVKQTGYPSLRYVAKHNVRMSLGTDWGNTEMVEEMRFVRQLPLVVAGLRYFSAVEVLKMATINGAVALGVSGELGSIETNKRADFVFFDISSIRLPVVQTNSAEEWSRLVVEHLSTADIADVMVRGEFRVRHRETTERGERATAEEFRTTLAKYFLPSTAQSLQPATEAKTNVLPFLTERLPSDEQAGSFETGFSPSSQPAKILEIAADTHPLKDLPKPRRESIKPELPKDARRIFGDDEEF